MSKPLTIVKSTSGKFIFPDDFAEPEVLGLSIVFNETMTAKQAMRLLEAVPGIYSVSFLTVEEFNNAGDN